MTLDATSFALHVIGAFYVFAGFVVARMALTSHLLDQALAAIAMKPVPRVETLRLAWLISQALLVTASGAALLMRLDVASPLFLITAAAQAFYLAILAPLCFDPHESPGAQGRRQTTNAFVIYLAATAFAVWASLQGRLTPWNDAGTPTVLAFIGIMAAHALYLMRGMYGGRGRGSHATARTNGGDTDDDDHDEDVDVEFDQLVPAGVKVMAKAGRFPLWAVDDGMMGDLAPERFDLSAGLIRDLNGWSEAYCAAFDTGELPSGAPGDQQRLATCTGEARALAERFKSERPDLLVYVEEPGYGLVEITSPDPAPGEFTGGDRT